MTTLPPRLREEGATDLERLLLSSAAEERPAAELSHKMLAGLSAAAVMGASSSAAAASNAGVKASALLKWALGGVAAISIGAFALSFPSQEDKKSQAPAAQKSEPTLSQAQTLPSSKTQPEEETPGATDARAPHRQPMPAEAPVQAGKDKAPGVSLRAAPEIPTLSQELLLLDQVRTAISESRLDRATRLLGVYKSRYPSGVLRQEATMLEVKVRRAQGDIKAAAALEADFAKRHPESAHRNRDLAPLGPAPSE